MKGHETTMGRTETTPATERLYPIGTKDRPFRTLASGVVAELEAEIIRLGWPVGTIIATEQELLERFGVSPPVLRQAVGILEREQIAKMRRGPGGGLLVLAPDERVLNHSVAMFLEFLRVDPSLASEARAKIEIDCVELAAERISEDDVPRLRAIVEAEPEIPTPDTRSRVTDVHFAIAELSGNPVLTLFVKMLHSMLAERMTIPTPLSDGLAARYRQNHEEHVGIVDALVSGDASLARLRMTRHLENTRLLAAEHRSHEE